MQKLTKTLLFILSIVLLTNTGYSQCTPDPNCTDPDGDGEFCPTEFPYAIEDEYYDQTLTVIAPIEQQGIQLHHIEILGIDNIPPGMSYQCQDNNCSFYPSIPKCVSVFGTPEIGSWGSYTLYLSIEVFMDVAGFPVSLGVIEDSSASVVIQPKLHADFTIADTENFLCSGWEYILSYAGNASIDANYNWNFGESFSIISGEDQGPYTIVSENYFGDYDSISLFVTEGPYTSPIFTEVYLIDICSGTDENPLASLYTKPNPFKDYIQINGLGDLSSQIEIFDLMGRKVQTYISHENNTKLYLSDLRKGIYFLSVTSGNNIKTIKIIKE